MKIAVLTLAASTLIASGHTVQYSGSRGVAVFSNWQSFDFTFPGDPDDPASNGTTVQVQTSLSPGALRFSGRSRVEVNRLGDRLVVQNLSLVYDQTSVIFETIGDPLKDPFFFDYSATLRDPTFSLMAPVVAGMDSPDYVTAPAEFRFTASAEYFINPVVNSAFGGSFPSLGLPLSGTFDIDRTFQVEEFWALFGAPGQTFEFIAGFNWFQKPQTFDESFGSWFLPDQLDPFISNFQFDPASGAVVYGEFVPAPNSVAAVLLTAALAARRRRVTRTPASPAR
jgi:hypothetical protein